MTDPATHSTFTVERVYPKPVETVFAVLADPAKRRRWYAESDHHQIESYESDFRIGGADRLHYRFLGNSPVSGMVIANEGRFEDIVPGRRVVSTGSMWLMDACVSASLVTMELAAVDTGTRLTCTVQGVFFEGSDGPKLREMGWNILLDRLGASLA